MTTILTEAELEKVAQESKKYERTAAIRITLRGGGLAYSFIGDSVELRYTELLLDDKRVARWRHDLTAWLDEHGRSYSNIKIEAIS